MNEHTHKQFDAEMEAIRSGVLAMGGLVETQLARAIAVLGDDEEEGAIDQVGAVEQQINQMQMTIDQQCSQIIAKRQPAAIDLRMILTITKIVNDLERIGDEVKKIAYKAAQTRGSDRLTQVRHHDVARAAGHAQDMLQMALDVFARLDAAAAAEVIDRDEEIDAAFLADPAPAHQLHDGGPAHDHARRWRSCSSPSRSSASATTRRTSPRRSCRSCAARTCGTRRPSRSGPRSRRNERADCPLRGRADHAAAMPKRGDVAMTPTILVVEDEPAILELITVNLIDAGYEVHGAADAEAAQARLKDALPALVLLDWMLPGQSGLALRQGAARRRADEGAADHHGHGAHRRGGQDRRARGVGRRLRDQAVLAARAEGADQGGAAAAGAGSGAGAAARPGRCKLDPSTHRVTVGRAAGADRPDRVPAAALSSSRVPSACTRARNCSTRSGATRCTSRSARSTSTSGGCGSRWNRSARTG